MNDDNEKKLPSEFIPEETYVLDTWDCDACGDETHGYGHETAGGRWLCGYCHYQQDEDITEVVGECHDCPECGTETPFEYEDGSGVCYVCKEIFVPEGFE